MNQQIHSVGSAVDQKNAELKHSMTLDVNQKIHSLNSLVDEKNTDLKHSMT